MPLTSLTQPVTFDSLIKDLEKGEVISAELAQKVLESKNINLPENSVTVLMYAISKNVPLCVIEELIRFGADISIRSVMSTTPLMFAAMYGCEEMTAYFLKKMDNVSDSDLHGHTVLHVAVANNEPNIVMLLLKDPRIQAIKEMKDLEGRTALTLAMQCSNDACISALTGEPADKFKSNPSYGQIPPPAFTQREYDEKLGSYLKSQGVEDVSTYIQDRGTCNALSFIFPLYKYGLKNPAYYEALRFSKQWDIGAPTELPAALKGHFTRKGVDHPGYVLEHLVNDTVFYQAHSKAFLDLKLPIKQDSRHEQYDVTQGKDSPLMEKVVSYRSLNSLTKEQLNEMLHFLSGYRGCLIMIAGGGHATSLYITRTGNYEYYDSNYNVLESLLFTDVEALSDHIVKSKYVRLGRPHIRMWVDFDVYLFKDNAEPSPRYPNIELPEDHFAARDPIVQDFFLSQMSKMAESEAESASRYPYLEGELPAVSPNGFTELHYAVMSKNFDKIRSLIDSGTLPPDACEKKDAHGKTPVERALTLGFTEIALYLLNKFEFSQDHLLSLTSLAMICADVPCFEKLILLTNQRRDHLYRDLMLNINIKSVTSAGCNDRDIIPLLDIVAKKYGQIDFSTMPDLIAYIISSNKDVFLQYMFMRNPTPLMKTAVSVSIFKDIVRSYEGNPIMLDLVIDENQGNIHAKDTAGKTLMDYAVQYNKPDVVEYLKKIEEEQRQGKSGETRPQRF